jgi:DNA-binding NarL/FixJ family response regulator
MALGDAQRAGDGRPRPREPTASGPILVVNRAADLRRRICGLLAGAGYETLEARGGQEALDLARRQRPVLIVLDVPLDDFCGYAVCRTRKDEFGEELPVVFVSGQRAESFDRVAGLLAGADDYLAEPLASDEFLLRVRRLVRHFIPVTPKGHYNLTSRELEVLELLAQGLRQKQIAAQLFLSPKTVGTHTERIYRKLGVRTRAQAVAVAYRDHLALAHANENKATLMGATELV